MNTTGKSTGRYRLVVCLLAVALLVQLLFPLHFHLRHQHVPESQGHDHHVIDYHLIADTHTSEDMAHKDDHDLTSTPEALVKKALDRDSGALLTACLLLILPLTLALINRCWLFARNTLTHTLYYGLAPPLRAPPVI